MALQSSRFLADTEPYRQGFSYSFALSNERISHISGFEETRLTVRKSVLFLPLTHSVKFENLGIKAGKFAE